MSSSVWAGDGDRWGEYWKRLNTPAARRSLMRSVVMACVSQSSRCSRAISCTKRRVALSVIFSSLLDWKKKTPKHTTFPTRVFRRIAGTHNGSVSHCVSSCPTASQRLLSVRHYLMLSCLQLCFQNPFFCSVVSRISRERGVPGDGRTPTSLDPLSSDFRIKRERYSATNILFDAALERMMFLRLLGIERFDCSVSFIRFYLVEDSAKSVCSMCFLPTARSNHIRFEAKTSASSLATSASPAEQSRESRAAQGASAF